MGNMPRLPQIEPGRNDKCFCGSGSKYKICCKDHLPGSKHLGDRRRAAIKSKNFEEALAATRADFTQYTIWHKSHTERALRAGMPTDVGLLPIDMDAMSEFVLDIAWLYVKLDRQAELPAFVERLRTNSSTEQWNRRLTYTAALLWISVFENRDRAFDEFKKLAVNVSEEGDLQILQMYMDFYGDTLSFSSKLSLTDKIIGLVKDEGERLQYRLGRATQFFLIGDCERARNEAVEAVDHARSWRSESPKSRYFEFWFAESLVLLGLFNSQAGAFEEAAMCFHDLLSDPELTPSGKARLSRMLGDCYRHQEKWVDAENAYRASLDSELSSIVSVFLSDSVLRQGKPEAALQIIGAVDCSDFDESEKFDHAFHYSLIAVELEHSEAIKDALKLLSSVRCPEPFFEKRRLSMIIHVQRALSQGKSSAIVSAMKKLFSPLAYLNRYVLLQPNVMGLGLNINAAIEDATRKSSDLKQNLE